MKIYPPQSALTIRQRIERLALAKRKHDPWVNVYYNGSSDSVVFGFFLSDWNNPFDDFQSYKELDYRLDTETKSAKYINLGFSEARK